MLGYTLRVGTLLLWNAKTGPRASPSEPFRVNMRAWPWYCDAYRHLNNAVYLRLAENARWAWTAKTALLGKAIAGRWTFIVGAADVVYRRPIPLMSSFELVCRVEGVDDRWLYFSQEFVLPSGKSACRILIRAMIRDGQGHIPPADILETLNMPVPAVSEELQQLIKLGSTQLERMDETTAAGAP